MNNLITLLFIAILVNLLYKFLSPRSTSGDHEDPPQEDDKPMEEEDKTTEEKIIEINASGCLNAGDDLSINPGGFTHPDTGEQTSWCEWTLANSDITGATCSDMDPDGEHSYAGRCNLSCQFGQCAPV